MQEQRELPYIGAFSLLFKKSNNYCENCCLEVPMLHRFVTPAPICNLCPILNLFGPLCNLRPPPNQFEIPKTVPICNTYCTNLQPLKPARFVIPLLPRFVIQKKFSFPLFCYFPFWY